jgi:transcription antitermination factor NusG
MAKFWSCAQTRPRAEPLAIRNLRRQRFRAFYPFLLVRNRFHRLTVMPVFPSYVFVELDDAVPNWSPINSTLGVRRLLTQLVKHSEYRRPANVGFAEDLRRLRIRSSLDAVAPAEESEGCLPPGTVVRVRRGPFAERVALVSLSSAARVKLLLEFFNREISISFDLDDVEIVAPLGEPSPVERIEGL